MSKYKFKDTDYPTKGYFHFDYPVSISDVESYVRNPEEILKHSFLPLIAYDQIIEKYTEVEADFTDGRPYKKKPRPIRYSGHLDGYIYKYYAHQLNHDYNLWVKDKDIDDCSTAYRTNKKGKSNINFAAEVINYMAELEDSFVLVGDFKGYFDSLDHQSLKKRIYEVMSIDYLTLDWFNVFKSVTKYGYTEKKSIEEYFGDENLLRQNGHRKFINNNKKLKEFRKLNLICKNDKGKGIPQGVPISAVLANIYAIHFDQSLNEIAKKHDGLYRRYSDDFILVIPSKGSGTIKSVEVFKELVLNIKLLATQNKLDIAPDKMFLYQKTGKHICRINKNSELNKSSLDYLGFVYDGINVSVRQRSIENFYKRMRNKVKRLKVKRNKNNRKAGRAKLKKLPQRYQLYGLFTDSGFTKNDGRKGTNFIDYVKRSQKIFDEESTLTNNIMMSQIANRKKKLEKLLGYRISFTFD